MKTTGIHRVGLGTDLHRIVPGRKLILGGVEIPFDQGLAGHSDADIVLHALTDALLGAAALPDIGELFPDTDPRFKDADSRMLLAEALTKVRGQGWSVVNIDLVIHAERPKLSPYKEAIRRSLAALLAIPPDRVGVKAKTHEGLDAIGRGEAIACTCVVGLANQTE